MTDRNRSILLALLLLSVTAGFLDVWLTQALWAEEDARWEAKNGPTPTLEHIAPYDRSIASLRRWRALAAASSMLCLGALVFLHQRRKAGPKVWTRAALVGLVSFVVAAGLFLSVGKQGIPAERAVGIPVILFALLAGGITIGASLLAWVTGRIGPRIVGVVLLLLGWLVFAGTTEFR